MPIESNPVHQLTPGQLADVRRYARQEVSSAVAAEIIENGGYAGRKLTVVIMNWARPLNLIRFVSKYARHERVGEVIVWDASPDNRLNSEIFDAVGPARVVVVRAWADLGLYARFAMGALSTQNGGVLIVDDDIELPTKTITALHDKWLTDKTGVIHGLIGRQPTPDGSYTAPTVHGPVQIVLTRALITSPAMCAKALTWGVRHMKELPGKPRGNGEDIVLSHVAMAETGLLNVAHDLPYMNHDFDDKNSINKRFAGHGDHRTAMVRWCRTFILGGKLPTVLSEVP